MYDIHHHLLYGLDDGPPTIDISVEMANMAADDGITHVVCTPHASDNFAFRPDENSARIAELRSRIGNRLTLGLGCDFHLSYENIEDAQANPTKYTINGGQYLLVEFPEVIIPPRISEAMYELRLAGMTLIITHPERNRTLRTQTERLAGWLREGHLIQVTAGAVMGHFGKSAQQFAHEFLKRRWVHVLATDAHDPVQRPPRLTEAREFVARNYGHEYADQLCIHNPKAIFENAALPTQPEPDGVFDAEEPPKPSLLKRLFSRS
jgi:protein-tyrosine phosphatase